MESWSEHWQVGRLDCTSRTDQAARLSPVTPQLKEAFRRALEQHLASTVRRALTSGEPLAEDTTRPSLKELLLRPGTRTEQLTPLICG